ncbi:hypothetical protein J7T55_014238 [Diaporthe amygdali]|uniref:uncharacterized protein n=1 Tax=Phomopsis amygdali TaxID=1214568 RepID=UPI0022FF1D74|nr:uncharacterized protein J7T55_014238 [Diaporthe amygdali]KAJ0109676.1 hypothetical protein J7T55_014238 [Diaporthe amygdali]
MGFFSLILIVVLLGAGALYLNLDRIVNYVAQILVDASKMDITSIEITNCDETGFTINLSAKIYDTGPLEATISDMTLSMFSTKSGKEFARVRLPSINATPSGTVCEVSNQRVEILDFDAFNTFNRNLLLQEELPAYVSGSGTLTIPWPLRLSTTVRYEKVEVLRGLDGVHISVLETRKPSGSLLKGKPTEIEVDVCIASGSPVAIQMGVTQVSIVYSGMRIATVEADLFLKPGENLVTFTGEMDFLSIGKNLGTGLKFLKQDIAGDPDMTAFVKGAKGPQCSWLDRTIRLMDSKIVMGSTMADLVRSISKVEGSQ